MLKSVFVVSVFVINVSMCSVHPDAFKTVPKILDGNGYRSETHEVLTEDGYYLTLFRIPNGTNNASTKSRFPVLLVHGLMGSSADFILSGPGYGLGYLLSDEGFDVWLLNCRGTRYSEKHKVLNTTNSKFWDYSWHEIGKYDVPAAIDHILQTTGYPKLFHIGMSQGVTSFYVMLSEKPEYNEKIIVHVSYTPAAFLCYTTNALFRFGSIPEAFSLYAALLNEIGPFNAGPALPFLPILTPILCKCGEDVCSMCKIIAYLFLDIQHANMTLMDVSLYTGHLPGGASIKSLIHYAQSINSCEFRRFKKSIFDNPEEYNLKNVNTTLYVFYGEKDNIQNPKDTIDFRSKLPDGFKETFMIKDYGHSDFIVAMDAKVRVYDKTISILKQYIT